MFADVELELIKVFRSHNYESGSSTPEMFSDNVFVKVSQIGGPYDAVHQTDEPVVDVTVLATPESPGQSSYGRARTAANQVRHILLNLGATRTPGGFLFDTVSPSGLIHVPNDNPDVTEFLITVNIRSRTRVRHMKEIGNE